MQLFDDFVFGWVLLNIRGLKCCQVFFVVPLIDDVKFLNRHCVVPFIVRCVGDNRGKYVVQFS